MSPNGGGVEHLHEMGGLAVRGERLEQGLEDTRLAQTPEPFPDAVPIAELGRERPPRDVVDREIVQRLEELAVVAAPCRPAASGRPETASEPPPNRPPSSPSASRPPHRGPAAELKMVNTSLNPSTRPRPWPSTCFRRTSQVHPARLCSARSCAAIRCSPSSPAAAA